jgi:formate dehydrogenase assembly factor FdhD
MPIENRTSALHRVTEISIHILSLSERASFEMMRKSLASGVPIVTAISAPSSPAVINESDDCFCLNPGPEP